MTKNKQKNAPNVLSVTLWLSLMAVMILAAGLVYYFAGSDPSGYEKIVIYVLLGGAALVVLRLAIWGFSWTRNERVSELGLHIVRFAVILTAVTLCVFAMMSSDYSAQYRQSAGNELRQQALAGRIHLQDMLGEELGMDAPYYQELYDRLPGLLDRSGTNDGRHVNLYLFVSPERQPAGTAFDEMDGNSGIFAASTNSRIGATAAPEYIDRVYREGQLTFSEYSRGEGSFMSAFVPVFTTAGRPVGVLELCEPGVSSASMFGFAAIELLLRISALIAMFSFGFYGVMQLLDILLRPRKVDRSCRVLSCGREAARPVLFFVAMCSGLPLMLLVHADEMKNLITLDFLPDWLSGITTLLPAGLYLLCFLTGWLVTRKTGKRLTEAPSNISLIAATVCTLMLMLIKDTSLFDKVAFLKEWYIPLALIAICGLCYGISFRTISKYQAQSDMLFGKDKYAYLCTALGVITGIILGAWLLDASGEPGVKVAMLLLNAASGAISIKLLEDLDQTVDISERAGSRISSVAGLMLPLIPLGILCGFVWVYLTGYLAGSDYSVTARSIITVAPVVAFCFGNRLRLKTVKAQRSALCLAGVIAGLAYLPMVWTPAPVMAVASCGLLCLAVIFMSAGVYSVLLPNERGGAFSGLAAGAAVGAIASSLLSGFYAGRLAMLIAGLVTVGLSLLILATKFPNRIPGPDIKDGIADGGFAAPYVPSIEEHREPEEEKSHHIDYAPAPVFMPEDPEPVSEPVSDPEPESDPVPELFKQPEENSYDWDKVDTQTADVMDEFASEAVTAEPAPAEETPASEDPAEKERTTDVFGGSVFAPESEDTGSAGAEDTSDSGNDAPPVIIPDEEESMPVIFPDADDEPQHSGYNPEGGAIPQSSEALGGDEGFIDYGL